MSGTKVLVHNKNIIDKLALSKGLRKILVKGEDDIVDSSLFNNKGQYKNSKLSKDVVADKTTAHRGSYWKLKNLNDKSMIRTLDINGKILKGKK